MSFIILHDSVLSKDSRTICKPLTTTRKPLTVAHGSPQQLPALLSDSQQFPQLTAAPNLCSLKPVPNANGVIKEPSDAIISVLVFSEILTGAVLLQPSICLYIL